MSVAIATCRDLPDLDPDDALVLPELVDRGAAVEVCVWDDDTVDWSLFDVVVVRSTWDYPPRRDEFVRWSSRVPRLFNPGEVIAWNTDKLYLDDLRAAGVPVVPTTFVSPGQEHPLPAHGVFVVKPTISAGSLDTERYDADATGEPAAAAAHVRRLTEAGRTVMIQPYLSGVDTHGETALVHIGGTFSHAIRKGPILHVPEVLVAGLYRDEAISDRVATAAELRVAQMALAAAGDADLLYARVDLLPDADGNPILLELELTEPSLFLGHDEAAPGRLADAIIARAGSNATPNLPADAG